MDKMKINGIKIFFNFVLKKMTKNNDLVDQNHHKYVIIKQ